MHASSLVELSQFVASQHHAIRAQRTDLSHWAAPEYWAVSRVRLQAWSEKFRACQEVHRLRNVGPLSEGRSRDFWETVEPLLEEVLLAEVCTRVWCATLSAIDDEQFPGELDPVARSVFVGHLEARRLALRMLLFARGLPGITTSSTERLRRDCEVWTDMILAQLAPPRIVWQFGFQRRSDWPSNSHLGITKYQSEYWMRQSLSMRFALAARATLPSVCSEFNAEIGQLILGCLPVSSFDSCGIPRSGWYASPFQSDKLSVDVLADLCGPLPTVRPRFPRHPGRRGG